MRHKEYRYSFEEFCALTGDKKADLIDGVIYFATPEDMEAKTLTTWLVTLLTLFVEAADLGQILAFRVPFRMDDDTGTQPDVGFVAVNRLQLVNRICVKGAPDAIFEVVTPESTARDCIEKRRIYEEARVAEYWMIETLRQRATLLSLDRSGQYRELPPRQGKLSSKVLPGFWIRLEWLWQQPRPKVLDCWQEIGLANQRKRLP
jgi:Uma2 family endonuclease